MRWHCIHVEVTHNPILQVKNRSVLASLKKQPKAPCTFLEHVKKVECDAYRDDSKHTPAEVVLQIFLWDPIGEETHVEARIANADFVEKLVSVLPLAYQRLEVALVHVDDQVSSEDDQDLENFGLKVEHYSKGEDKAA